MIIDGQDDEGRWLGRTQGDAPEIDGQVVVDNQCTVDLQPGDIVNVKITAADDYDLYGMLLS